MSEEKQEARFKADRDEARVADVQPSNDGDNGAAEGDEKPDPTQQRFKADRDE